MAVRRVTTEAGARELAAQLLGHLERPVVMVTAGYSSGEGLISAEAVLEGVGEFAEVVWMPTGDATWAFKEAMPFEAQLFGDAARVYSVDGAWRQNARLSRLHMCASHGAARRIEDALVAEAMQAAAAAGLLSVPTSTGRVVSGRVVGFPSAGRALVRGDFGFGTVWEAALVSGVAIDRLLRQGMTVTGRFDSASRVLDVSGMLRQPSEALAEYAPEDVVPVRVVGVSSRVVTVQVHPSKNVEVGIGQVTGSLHDDLAELFTVGEIVPARVVRADPCVLSMLGVDELEARPAFAVIEGGQPWLEFVEPELESESEPEPEPETRSSEPEALQAATETSDAVDLRAAHAEQRNAIESLRLEIDHLRAAVTRAEAAEAKALRQIEHLKTQKRQLIAKGNKQRSRPAERTGPAFLDAEDQFRHEVYLAWVAQVPAAEKSSLPLPEDWRVGPRFLDSLDDLEGVARGKVAEVVVQVLTGRAHEIPGREVHRLRTGAGGEAAPREREPGEYCWRVALQRNTPGARRLHYWDKAGRVELSRVVHHDDMQP